MSADTKHHKGRSIGKQSLRCLHCNCENRTISTVLYGPCLMQVRCKFVHSAYGLRQCVHTGHHRTPLLVFFILRHSTQGHSYGHYSHGCSQGHANFPIQLPKDKRIPKIKTFRCRRLKDFHQSIKEPTNDTASRERAESREPRIRTNNTDHHDPQPKHSRTTVHSACHLLS